MDSLPNQVFPSNLIEHHPNNELTIDQTPDSITYRLIDKTLDDQSLSDEPYLNTNTFYAQSPDTQYS